MGVILYLLGFGILLAIPAYGLYRQERLISRGSTSDRHERGATGQPADPGC